MARTETLFASPASAYTRSLVAAMPEVKTAPTIQLRLAAIAGAVHV
jgi:ABC-type antimicrobial peptide transport system ATPase subunit